jgi:hypothetical protein
MADYIEDVSRLLEDLQVVVSNHQVRSSTGALLDAEEDNRWCNKRRFRTIEDSD